MSGKFKCDNFAYNIKKDNDGNEFVIIIGVDKNATSLFIPDLINGIPVTKISSMAAEYCEHLSEVHFSRFIDYIGTGAFRGCTALKSVKLPPLLERVQDFTFFYCSNLTEVLFNDGLVDIGQMAFQQTGIESVKLPDSLENLYCGAFTCCDKLVNVEFGNNLKVIEGKVFDRCSAIKSINFPASLKCVSDSSFDFCKGLESVSINSDINNFTGDEPVFFGCDSLKTIKTADTNKRIIAIDNVLYDRGVNALVRFPPNSEATALKIPEWVNYLYKASFNNVKNLTDVYINSSNEIKNIFLSQLDDANSSVSTIHCKKSSPLLEYKFSKDIKIKTTNDLTDFLSEISDKNISKDDIS